MVSSLNLAYMHLRLEELFGRHDWFGGRNVLFVGDLLQLQPVNGSPVFEKNFQKSPCVLNWAVRHLSISGQIQWCMMN